MTIHMRKGTRDDAAARALAIKLQTHLDHGGHTPYQHTPESFRAWILAVIRLTAHIT